MLALRGRNAALLSSLSAPSTSDGLDTRIAGAHRGTAGASQINPFADLAGRAARLGLGVAKLEQGGHVVKTVCDRRLRWTAACQQRGSPFIFRMVTENPNWGAPRIHGELLTLGFDLSERSVWRWIRRARRDPDPLKRWLTFTRNHREAIAAMGFFTVRPSSIELTVQGYRWISGRTK